MSTITSNGLSIFYKIALLEPVVQLISVAEAEVMVQSTSSIVTLVLTMAMFVGNTPTIEIDYPPNTEPVFGVMLLTIGVASFLN